MGEADYTTLAKVGEGAFGTVFRARDRNGVEVALKRTRVRDVRELPINAVREMNALRRMSHPNVVPLLGVHTHGANLVLVMPFEPRSLASVLAERDAALSEPHAAALSRMLLCGLCAVHGEGLLHRDIKPHNLLISANGTLRLADFGQARLLPTERDASLSHAVASRWYRAPELLLGSRRYGAGVDLWAAGCVIAQLHTLSALLPGDSDIDQLFRVVRFLGSPSTSVWPGLEVTRRSRSHAHATRSSRAPLAARTRTIGACLPAARASAACRSSLPPLTPPVRCAPSPSRCPTMARSSCQAAMRPCRCALPSRQPPTRRFACSTGCSCTTRRAECPRASPSPRSLSSLPPRPSPSRSQSCSRPQYPSRRRRCRDDQQTLPRRRQRLLRPRPTSRRRLAAAPPRPPKAPTSCGPRWPTRTSCLRACEVALGEARDRWSGAALANTRPLASHRRETLLFDTQIISHQHVGIL